MSMVTIVMIDIVGVRVSSVNRVATGGRSDPVSRTGAG